MEKDNKTDGYESDLEEASIPQLLTLTTLLFLIVFLVVAAVGALL